ncbi:MAG: hypothetical protein U0271_28465 [Polyangiaceae bacterium]
MSNQLKIVIENDTDYALFVPGGEDDFILDAPGTLVTGSNLPPNLLKARASADFTVCTPIGGPGPEGHLRMHFDAIRLDVSVVWTDFTNCKPKVTKENGEDILEGVVSPCYVIWRQLDGALGELEHVTVKYTDDQGKDWDFDKLAAYHDSDKVKQQAGMKQAAADPKTAGPVVMRTLVATFKLRVKNVQANVAPPAGQRVTMPAGVVRPTGGSRVLMGAKYWTWNAPGISQRRKRLLATLANRFPMVWDQKAGDIDPVSQVPFQDMEMWTPGNGTSCTSVSTNIENFLVGKGGKWGFAAYYFEEAWVPWAANPAKKMPNVGDVYLLYSDLERVVDKVPQTPQLRHVGFILHVPASTSERWVTADGGQQGKPGRGQGGGGALVGTKQWEKRIPTSPNPTVWEAALKAHPFAKPIADTEYIYVAGGSEASALADGNRMLGWLDIDSPAISFLTEAFDAPLADNVLQKPGQAIQQRNRWSQKRNVTENDYWFVGAWIDFMRNQPNNLAQWVAHLKDPQKNPPPAPSESTVAP